MTERTTTTISVRMPIEFAKNLNRDAEDSALSRNSLCLSRLFGEAADVLPKRQKRIPADMDMLRKIYGLLGRISSNHNQIAKKANTFDDYRPELKALEAIGLHLGQIDSRILDALNIK